MDPDTRSYLKSWSDEFAARANRVRYLIGSAHWLSDGTHKEAILRDFLRVYLPSQLTITRGFVRTAEPEPLISNEIDILILDTNRHAPFFLSPELAIAPPNSVSAHAEVKSRFNSTSIQDALEKVARTQLLISTQEQDAVPSWSGIYFFQGENTLTAKRMLDIIYNRLQTMRDTYRANGALGHRHFSEITPTCITIFDRFTLFITRSEDKTRIRCFDLGTLSASVAMLDLFSAIRSLSYPVSRDYFEQMVRDAVATKPEILDLD